MTNQKITLNLEAKVLGDFDTIVCGGGTAGVIAALASARNGAKTLLIEKGYYLGGMMTMGNAGLTKYVKHGITSEEQFKINEELKTNPENVQVVGGIPLEITNDLIKNGDAIGTYGTGASYVYTDSHAFKLYLFEALKKAGVKILLHSKVLKVLMDGTKISGIVFDSKEGPMAAYAKYVVDATGDADVSYLAGATCMHGATEDDSVVKNGQVPVGTMAPVGTMYRMGGIDYDKFFDCVKNDPDRFFEHYYAMMGKEEFLKRLEDGDSVSVLVPLNDGIAGKLQVYTYPREGIIIGCSVVRGQFDGTKAEDLTEAEYHVLLEEWNNMERFRKALPGFENAYIVDVPQAGIRETRRVDGEYRLTMVDILKNEDFYDTIALSAHPIDVSPRPKECDEIPLAKRAFFRVPYRSLVAKGIDNLLLAGRLISTTREAFGCTRVTVCCMATGEAAGTAAALLSKDGGKAKDIDIENLRETLKKNGVKC